MHSYYVTHMCIYTVLILLCIFMYTLLYYGVYESPYYVLANSAPVDAYHILHRHRVHCFILQLPASFPTIITDNSTAATATITTNNNNSIHILQLYYTLLKREFTLLYYSLLVDIKKESNWRELFGYPIHGIYIRVCALVCIYSYNIFYYTRVYSRYQSSL